MRLLLLVLPSLLLVAGCSVRGKDGVDGLTRTTKAPRVVKELSKNAFATEFLEGSARIKLESDELNVGGTATIRLERDKAIWMSVKKFGFEGARALIRPDSFFVYNRLKGEYTAEPLSYIEEKYQVPAEFDLLQQIILGNAIFFTRDLDLKSNGDRYELSGQDSRYATAYVVDGRGFKLERMDLEEVGKGRRVTILNSDFQPVEGAEQTFAHERTVRVSSDDDGDALVEMSFSRVRLGGPLEMPFKNR